MEVQCPPVKCYTRVWCPEVCEKQVPYVKYVQETCVKKIPYTVCKMVPETRVKTCTYKVCRMMSEVCEKRIPYTVCRMVPEQRCRTYQVCKMVPETRVKTCTYTVRKMVPEQRCYTYQVCKMVPETCVKTCTYQVCKMVPEQRCRSYQVCKMVPEQRCYTYQVRKMVPETCVKTCTYQVCKMVPEQRCYTYQVRKMVPETCVKTCTYQVCKMVPEQRCRTYQVCKMVPETCVKTCTYQVCRMVSEQRVKTCTYQVCKMVPETCTKMVPYTVCKPVCYEKTVHCTQWVTKQVPYTITRCVPHVVCREVPVTVCCPMPRCCNCCPACPAGAALRLPRRAAAEANRAGGSSSSLIEESLVLQRRPDPIDRAAVCHCTGSASGKIRGFLLEGRAERIGVFVQHRQKGGVRDGSRVDRRFGADCGVGVLGGRRRGRSPPRGRHLDIDHARHARRAHEHDLCGRIADEGRHRGSAETYGGCTAEVRAGDRHRGLARRRARRRTNLLTAGAARKLNRSADHAAEVPAAVVIRSNATLGSIPMYSATPQADSASWRLGPGLDSQVVPSTAVAATTVVAGLAGIAAPLIGKAAMRPERSRWSRKKDGEPSRPQTQCTLSVPARRYL